MAGNRNEDEFRFGLEGIFAVNDPFCSGHCGGIGSVELLVEADTDNVGEGDQPRITLSQDGGAVKGQFGYFDSSNDLKVINNFGGAKVLLKSNGDVCIGKNC